MKAEDDMIVVVVVDDDDKAKCFKQETLNSEDPNACVKPDMDNIIETAQKFGEYIPIKSELKADEYKCEDGVTTETYANPWPDISGELKREEIDQDIDGYSQPSKRSTMLKPWQQRSFVAELRVKNEDLREDEELLISTLVRIMRMENPPPPPPNYYIMNGSMYICVYCGYISDTLPAASRHYQKKHGPQYLVCYACGVDFRSATNLYKHEKRCVAPDAQVVLRARAVLLGRKGRGRPTAGLDMLPTKQDKFLCSQCSATFVSKNDLYSHENLHRGERPYRCHVCPYAYTSFSALTRHAKKHTDVEYICDHCDRSFKVRGALVTHMNTHNPTRRFGCEECNRRFAQKSALMLHVNRVHRNLPPPCACKMCPKRYPRMYLLKKHMKRAHGMSIITRKMFLKTLPTMSEQEVNLSKDVLQFKGNGILAFPVSPIKVEPESSEEEGISLYDKTSKNIYKHKTSK